MRLVIDIQGAQTESRFRGIGRYTMSLSEAIVRNRGEHEVILAASDLFPDTIEPIRAAFDAILPQQNIRLWHAPGPVHECEPGNELRRQAAERIREAFLLSLQPDIVLISSLFEGHGDDAVTSIGVFDQNTPTAVILHDLIPLIAPDASFKADSRKRDYYARKIESLIRSCCLLANSDSSRQEAIRALSVPQDAVVTISAACDPRFHQVRLTEAEKDALRRRLGISRPFIMYNGAADDRKNLQGLIEAYARLPKAMRSQHQLVLVGRMLPADVQALRHVAVASGLAETEVIFTGYVADDDLVRLYNTCKLYVFPSLHEGFGLPLLEAMACGAPVIAARATSVPEIVGRDDALFDPKSVAAMRAKMVAALESDSFRSELIAHGTAQVRKFSWQDTAQRALKSLEQFATPTREAGSPAFENAYEPRSREDDVINRLVPSIANLPQRTWQEGDLLDMSEAITRSIPRPSGERQLLVDVSELSQRDAKSGIQRVVSGILWEWLKSPPAGYRVEPVYATLHEGYRYARHFTAKFFGVRDGTLADDPIEWTPRDFFFGLDLQAHVVAAHRPFYQKLRRHGLPVLFLVHDLLCVQMPQHFAPGSAENFTRWLEVVTENDGAVCISKATADQLVNWLIQHNPHRQRPFNIGWSHNGANIASSARTLGIPSDAETILQALRARPSFLMVGTVEPRKGYRQTLAAFEELWRHGQSVNLVVVGRPGWMVDELVQKFRSHRELNSRLFWLVGISDEYLEAIYVASACLIAASEGEGFGLPLIEAARHKVPIIARDIAVFREVASEHAFYFAGEDSGALAAVIQEWLALHAQGKHPKSEALPWLSWAQSAKRLQEILLRGDWYAILPKAAVSSAERNERANHDDKVSIRA